MIFTRGYSHEPKDLCGANTFEDAFQHPDFRTLLAFGYMGYTRHPDLPVPRVTQSMPTPKVSTDLERDYFPVLLKQIRSTAASSVPFSEAIKESEQHIVNLVAQFPVDSPLASPGDFLG
jgi:hypothetical protein